MEIACGESCTEELSRRDLIGGSNHGAGGGIERDGIAAVQHVLGRQQREPSGQGGKPGLKCLVAVHGRSGETPRQILDRFPMPSQDGGWAHLQESMA